MGRFDEGDLSAALPTWGMEGKNRQQPPDEGLLPGPESEFR